MVKRKGGKFMYREIMVRVFGKDAVNKVDMLRQIGIDFTDLVYTAVMEYEVEEVSTLAPFTPN